MPVYGPYAPTPPKTQWRVVVVSTEGTRRSLCFASQEAAAAMIPVLQQELQKESRWPLHLAIDSYLSYKQQEGLQESSVRCLARRLRGFLPAECDVKSVDVPLAQALYQTESLRRTRRGPLSAATHRAVLRNTRELWRWLQQQGLCTDNPWQQVRPVGRIQSGKSQLRHQEVKRLEQQLFADAQSGQEGALALLLQLYTGLRSSELLGLTVRDVERIDTESLTLVWIERGKTKHARRSVVVFAPVAALLHRHCATRPGEQRVFAAARTKQPQPGYLYKRLAAYCQKLKLPHCCPHALRGLYATLAIDGGAPSHAVAKALGHGSFAITAKHYASPSAVLSAQFRSLAAALHGSEALSIVQSLSQAERELLRKLLGSCS